MKKTLAIYTLLAAVITGGVYAMPPQGPAGDCDGPHMGMMGNPEQLLQRMTKQLDLTASQQEQIKPILQAEREKNAPLIEKMRDLHQQLMTAENAPSFDENKVRTIAASLAQIKTEMMVSKAKAHHQIRQILTPAQREKADAMREEMKDKRRGKHGGNMGM